VCEPVSGVWCAIGPHRPDDADLGTSVEHETQPIANLPKWCPDQADEIILATGASALRLYQDTHAVVRAVGDVEAGNHWFAGSRRAGEDGMVQGKRRQRVSPRQCRQTVLRTVRDAEAHARPLSPFLLAEYGS
jgi:hypothetical protein